MTAKEAYDIFMSLQFDGIAADGIFSSADLGFIAGHKIGATQTGRPVFFVSNTELANSSDVILELFHVLFDRKCKLRLDNGEVKEEVYTILLLESDDIVLQQFFIDVVMMILKRLPIQPSATALKMEIQRLIELLNKLSRPPRKTIQGLWGEMLIISLAKRPDVLIKAWHTSTNDKYDFNDGKDKIEVKCTTRTSRTHRFSSEQLTPNKSSELLIASIMCQETGNGVSVIDLKNNIINKLLCEESIFKLNDIIVNTLGTDYKRVSEVSFDYNAAVDSLLFFHYKDIPAIASETIPYQISNIKYDCCLDTVCSLTEEQVINLCSPLYKSFFV